MSKFVRSVLVTGGTSGLGYHAATEIANRRPDHCIVIASRTDHDKSADSINKRRGHDNVQFMHLDLADSKNIRSFVKTWGEKKLPPLSVLLLNAGLQFPNRIKYTAEGLEATFGINVVGHALLLPLLMPYMADEARIVVTSSGTHDPAQKTGVADAVYTTAEELAHPTEKTLNNPGRQRYSTSKLCNVLWTYALSRRLTKLPSNKKWTVVAFDPGLMPGTRLAREAGPVLRFLFTRILPALIPVLRLVVSHNIHRPEESGANLAWIGLDDTGTSGVYYEGRKEIKSSVDSYDEAKQEELWDWIVRNLPKDEQEKRQFEFEVVS
ncbi:uncharacterized protein Z518_02070 [Rhinocladiella mackenziei CBS 650.93]|uniref:Rhinocladiella mackenziei CBS 650.93 unplaced genomic scaffold supercont1.2, whole genome shotgun sequence n=1 Tax=Rhinocladiella mackenziei CBS 650.93 TaxID=1442369 RepID=A0A0D2FYP6_9EURO|nr:uncharacterized protein Z518_02070 [Rhinocladiella mackenziei CBS 650.93]KIX07417.1 hypothetical protein Z518_02070 [Rhinocladiella mackenziei CBS 650.93]